jgi:outer membrane beta-barrel protein
MKTFMLCLIFISLQAVAKTKNPAPPLPTSAQEKAEEIDLGKLTEKYWAEGKETELGVVQNRKYTSAKKIEVGLVAGTISSDPFLSLHQLGGSVGYHFSSYTSVHFTLWKNMIGPSDALKKFENETGSTVNTNQPISYYSAEVRQNFIYGKASLFGSSIIYVDLFVLAGLGITHTESGDNFTPSLGIGQKVYLNEKMALNLDYRVMTYGETILSKNPATKGNKVGERTNTSDAVSIGLSFFFL